MPHYKTWSRILLGVLFIAAGINHFVNAPFYLAMMPPYLPLHAELVALSGITEAALGMLLMVRKWQVVAGWGIVALCIAVFPANLHMALHPELFSQFSPVALVLRLPLQVVLMAWAWWYTCPAARPAH